MMPNLAQREPAPTRTYQVTRKLVSSNCVEGPDALLQAIWHILSTERYASPIYPEWYGTELQQFIGKGISFLRARIERTLREALTQDDRITNVRLVSVDRAEADSARVVFEVDTGYGKIQEEVAVRA